jgi:hypothetical protein
VFCITILCETILIRNFFLLVFRGTRNQGSLRELLQPLVQTVLDDSTLNTSTNPVEIYKNWINQQESETGQAT